MGGVERRRDRDTGWLVDPSRWQGRWDFDGQGARRVLLFKLRHERREEAIKLGSLEKSFSFVGFFFFRNLECVRERYHVAIAAR